jgi:hypothetical protein
MKDVLLDHLERRGLPFVMISGTWDQRWQRAIQIIEDRVLRRSVQRGSAAS